LKKSNNKASQHKIKRALKNKKRIQGKPNLSKCERKEQAIREKLILGSLNI
jgi:hypothetical protein